MMSYLQINGASKNVSMSIILPRHGRVEYDRQLVNEIQYERLDYPIT
jgi:hypothetical protein